MIKVGIIGGSGLENPDILKSPQTKKIVTPYGDPSSDLTIGKIGNIEVAILSRHGKKHTIPPTQVNNRANIWALKEYGCEFILATTACGSLREEISRGDLVILDQFIDFTKHRNVSFFDKFEPGEMKHTVMADPFNEKLRKILIKSAEELKLRYHIKGTVVTIEGPRFSTRAESNMFRLWGADVINMSLGGTDVSSMLQEAVNYALNNNVTVVVCMMNTNSNTVFYPAAYPGVIAVGSTNPDDKRSHPFFWNPSSGSNYGPHISVVAPGNYIYGLDYQSNSQYGYYWGGTSQATPLVCGLAALILAQDPGMTPAQIKTLIQSTAEDQVGDPAEDTPGWDQYYGYGRINAHNALLQLSGISEKDKKNRSFVVYPNPNNGIMSLNLLNAPGSESVVTIINSLGQMVYQNKIKDQISTIHISRVPGIYVIKVKQGTVEQSSKIVIF